MKVANVVRQRRGTALPPLKAKALRYLEEHSDEVFPYRDENLCRALGIGPSALHWTLWWLHRNGFIEKEKVDGRVYFGSRRAIANLRRRLGVAKPDGFQRAKANAARIRSRVGNIDVLELIDAVRGPWD